MEKNRCQVCEGPVVNGRCRLCGMPYRNDETLYHLNENRSDHYRHATNRARAMMRQEEIPLGDKRAGNTGTANRASGQSTVKRQNTTGNQNFTRSQSATGSYGGKNVTGKGNSTPRRDPSKNGNSSFSLIAALILLCVGVPMLIGLVKETTNTAFENTFHSSESAFVETYELYPGETMEAGVDLAAGHYIVGSEDGEVEFMIKGKNLEIGILDVSQDVTTLITLKEGDKIRIVRSQPEDAGIVLTPGDE